MEINMSWGLLLVVLGGIMEGTFALCMKFTRNWKWEHIWGAATFAALVLIPWPLALLTVPACPGACSTFSVWAIVFTACCGLNVGYCLYLMIKRKNFGQLAGAGTGRYWILAAIMGAVWAGGIAIYGLGVSYLGSFGAYAGWSIMLIASIVASNVSGVIVGEWKGTGTRPLATMGVALTVLMIAVVVLGYANRLLAG